MDGVRRIDEGDLLFVPLMRFRTASFKVCKRAFEFNFGVKMTVAVEIGASKYSVKRAQCMGAKRFGSAYVTVGRYAVGAMSFWIFKLAEQELYPDKPGEEYVFDNTHSVQVAAGDEFLYLDKRKGYSFTASGVVASVVRRAPSNLEKQRSEKVRVVFTATLTEVMWFHSPLSVSPTTKAGRRNRALLGITDANLLGWSHSIPRLSESVFTAILALAEPSRAILGQDKPRDFSVDDAWGKTRLRRVMASFTSEVLERHGKTCVVCGCEQKELLEVAHLSAYATDRKNRANPANALCLCAYCHKALDRRLIGLADDGSLFVSSRVGDAVAKYLFNRVAAETRRKQLNGVGPEFLRLTTEWARVADI